jgi:hypothetical protein
MKVKFLATAACVAALASSAQAAPAPALIQIDDVTENVVLYLNGQAHNFDGDRIYNFSLTYAPGIGQDVREYMSFDWASPNGFIPGGIIYTQLMETAPGAAPIASDEFLLMSTTIQTPVALIPGFHVTFTSADQWTIDRSPTLRLDELPRWQTVGEITNLAGGPPETVFQVMSVPEPETYAMMLAGLGLLGFMARRKARAS